MLRREFIAGSGALLFLGACGGPKDTIVEVTATAAAGANGPLPLTLGVFQLRDTGKFLTAGQTAMNDAATALGADLAGQDQLTLVGGGSAEKVIKFAPDATSIGVFAYFKDSAGKTVRASAPIKAGKTQKVTITANASGVSIS